jgi:sigma-B regulation protein RsbU (phosphoserine phosphatase)
MRILIAEDDRITRRSLQRQLEKWGHEVDAAEDGAEAWDRFQETDYDLVVTDWEMPKVDGRELIERIRGCEHEHYVYLIMLTGRAETADVVTGMEAGADDFLGKPFDRNELRVRLHAGERIIQLERKLAAQNQALSEANARMKRDLDAAADVQQDLLPKELPQSLGAQFAWHYEPCDELGGDILNVLPLDDRSIAAYLLDVSGHGVPAALLSVTLSRVMTTRDPATSVLIHTDGNPDGTPIVRDPAEVAERLNRQFPMHAQRGKYFTMAYAVLDTETRTLRYAIAGHPPPIYIRRGRPVETLSGGNFPIGIIEEADFTAETVQLEPGDRVYFYSDGITEATNAKGTMLDTEGLVELMQDTRDLPLADGLIAFVDRLKQWCESVPYADDISILALEVPA